MPSGPAPCPAVQLATDGMAAAHPGATGAASQPLPAGPALVEVHPGLITTTVWEPPSPPSKAARRGGQRHAGGAV
jgi:hypothetical protein